MLHYLAKLIKKNKTVHLLHNMHLCMHYKFFKIIRTQSAQVRKNEFSQVCPRSDFTLLNAFKK